jgi:serine/threonine-protein kinase
MNHPSDEQLEQLLAQDLPAGLCGPAEAHVDGCERCLDRLERLQRRHAADLKRLARLVLHPPPGADPPSSDGAAGGRVPLAPVPSTSRAQFDGYEILDHVGGGMGEIYRARHRRSGRVVALKTLRAPADADSPEHREQLARFHTEVAAVSRLQHPHVIAIYDVGEQGGRPYFTMEWANGGSLAEYLAGRPQPERLAATWIALLARTMHHVHQQGIVHRDLKPANVLLQESTAEDAEDAEKAQRKSINPLRAASASSAVNSMPKITDFGVAKLLDNSGAATHPLHRLGTPEYMAPEQAAEGHRPADVGPAIDVYALGAILYEMLTGRPPFKADEPLETLRQVRDEEPTPPHRLRPRLSRDLETICLKCLHKDPRRRFPSALALAEDLQRWLRGEPICARPSGRLERCGKWARRHPERAALAGLGVALVLALAAGWCWQLWAGNARYARQLADSADAQLLLIRYAVDQAAQKKELHDRVRAGGQRRGLEEYLERTKQEFMRWFTRPGESPPIINWFVMAPGGTILADSYDEPRSVGRNYAFRDYYAGLMGPGPGAGRPAVYLSRVYESEQDGRYKITATRRITEGGQVLGLLGASIACDARLVGLDMRRESPGARLVGPMDRTPRPGSSAGEDPPPFVVFLHRDYARAGQKPAAAGDAEVAALQALQGRLAAGDAVGVCSAGGFTHYARVGDSHFVVLSEQPYPWPLAAVLGRPLASLTAAVLLAALAAVLSRLYRILWRRRAAAAGAAPWPDPAG